VSYEDFLSLKYDHQLPSKLQYTFMNIDALFTMDPEAYPEVASLVRRIQNWDRKSAPDSKGAGTYAIFYYLVRKYINQQPNATFSEAALVPVLKETLAYMNTHFGSTEVALGDFIKVVRGNLEMPSFGLPDVLTAMHGVPYKDGRLKVTAGESYIQMVRFTSEGASIRSMVPYGSSNRPNSPHYADQLPLYMKFQTKAMPLDRAHWENEATRIYHPGE
jgi:acyl-homoserine-lactone acylase